jgi:hypothetical protein
VRPGQPPGVMIPFEPGGLHHLLGLDHGEHLAGPSRGSRFRGDVGTHS